MSQKRIENKTIGRASRFVLSFLKPMEQISMDTIGHLPSDMGINTLFLSLIRSLRTSSCFLNRRLWQQTPYGGTLADSRRLLSLSPTLAHTTCLHIFTKRRVSNTTPRYRILKKKMVSSNEKTKRSTVT